jgi:hypothetical protein
MKKTLLLIAGTFVLTSVQAQVPVSRSQSFIVKATATWCGPCGDWGWTTHENILADNMVGATPKAFVLTAYGDGGSNYYNKVADTLAKFNGGSWPNWSFNNKQWTVTDAVTGGIYNTITRSNLKKSADSFALIAPIASTGFSYTISGVNVDFKTKTRFWKAGSGTYNLAVYVIEDSVYGMQNGQTGSVYHHYVIRGSLSGNTFGDQIATGNQTIDQVFTKNYSYALDPTWNKSRLKFLTVIYKKNGTEWRVENANSVKSAATGIGEVPAAVDQMIVFPTPASDRLHISGALNVASDARISMVNTIGQTVYEKNVSYNGGQLKEDINLNSISNGVYNLVILSEGAQSMQKVVVAK